MYKFWSILYHDKRQIAPNQFDWSQIAFHTDAYLPKLLVVAYRKYMTSHRLPTLREGWETSTEWKFESVSYEQTDQPKGEGAGDA